MVKPLAFSISEFKGKYNISVKLTDIEAAYFEGVFNQVAHHAFKNRSDLFTGYSEMEECKREETFSGKFCTPIVKESNDKSFKYISAKITDFTEVVDGKNLPLKYDDSEKPICSGSMIGFMKVTCGKFNFNPSLDNKQKISIPINCTFVRFIDVKHTITHELTEEEKEYLDNMAESHQVFKKSKLEQLEEGEILPDEQTQPPLEDAYPSVEWSEKELTEIKDLDDDMQSILEKREDKGN